MRTLVRDALEHAVEGDMAEDPGDDENEVSTYCYPGHTEKSTRSDGRW